MREERMLLRVGGMAWRNGSDRVQRSGCAKRRRPHQTPRRCNHLFFWTITLNLPSRNSLSLSLLSCALATNYKISAYARLQTCSCSVYA